MNTYIRKFKFFLLVMLAFSISVGTNAQIHPDFLITKKVATTPVKNQSKTGTCWSYATLSFIESEALRLGKQALDLSEMYVVRHTYSDKAVKYIRYHGKANFSQGGQAHDVMNSIRNHGIVPEEVYTGLQYGSENHNHGELESILDGMLNGILKGRQINPTIAWLPAVNAVIETYLGKTPSEFTFQGKKYSPQSFAKEVVGINPDDYVEFTSYKIYPYYKLVNLEIPDNWSHDLYYNIPINDLMMIIENALANGHSVCWDGDVSEEDFNHKEGTAVLSMKDSDGIILEGIEKMRQSTFDNFTTTDDHLMHLVGSAKDNNGSVFYLIKNSWGAVDHKYGGYLYMSNWFAQLKTVAIMVHKDAIPKDIRKKLNL
jgi:bleomycin hydrolase